MTHQSDYERAAGTNHTNPSEFIAREMIRQRTTYQLVADFEQSEKTQMTDELPIVRGWLMDELEKRNPAAFACWLESNEISPRKFFCV